MNRGADCVNGSFRMRIRACKKAFQIIPETPLLIFLTITLPAYFVKNSLGIFFTHVIATAPGPI